MVEDEKLRSGDGIIILWLCCAYCCCVPLVCSLSCVANANKCYCVCRASQHCGLTCLLFMLLIREAELQCSSRQLTVATKHQVNIHVQSCMYSHCDWLLSFHNFCVILSIFELIRNAVIFLKTEFLLSKSKKNQY